MIAALLAQVGLPLLVRTVGSALGMIDNPLAASAAAALRAVDGGITSSEIPPEAVAEANRHVERLAELESAGIQAALKEVNQSARAEIASEDAYVRRMRPTFGYVMALTWGAQMTALAYIIVTDPAAAGAVVAAMASLGTIWSVGLGVLGIYVYKRSDEKRQGAAGDTGDFGSLGGLAERLLGSKAPAGSSGR
ncbi:MAG: 3TM-type holin [Rhodospirillaceae bacterium]